MAANLNGDSHRRGRLDHLNALSGGHIIVHKFVHKHTCTPSSITTMSTCFSKYLQQTYIFRISLIHFSSQQYPCSDVSELQAVHVQQFNTWFEIAAGAAMQYTGVVGRIEYR